VCRTWSAHKGAMEDRKVEFVLQKEVRCDGVYRVIKLRCNAGTDVGG